MAKAPSDPSSMQNPVQVYNPNTGDYSWVEGSDVFKFNQAARDQGAKTGFSSYWNKEGDRVYGVKPEESYHDPFLQGTVEGQNPYPEGPGTPPHVEGKDVRWQPDDPYYADPAPTYRDTGPLFPWEPGEGPTASEEDNRYTQQRNTSWDFDPFRPSPSPGPSTPSPGGGDNPFSTPLQLGRDSPWGDPNVEGGNKEFYQQQFGRMMAQQEAETQRRLGAALARDAQADVPRETPDMDWSWAYGGQGLPEVTPAGADSYFRRDGIGPNATNQLVIERMAPGLTGKARDFWLDRLGWEQTTADQVENNPNAIAGSNDSYWRRPNDWEADPFAQDNYLAAVGDPLKAMRDSNITGQNRPYLQEMVNALYGRTAAGQVGGVDIPTGYAAPISGGS